MKKKQTDFNLRCHQLLNKIPSGRVVTYKQIAEKLGSHAYRAVGRAMNLNKNSLEFPCHRVVRSDGIVGGFNQGVGKKISLLRKEGTLVVNGKIDLIKYGWKFD
jgi:methylated-DNA-[protein]-cysteine S-methyltransferase